MKNKVDDLKEIHSMFVSPVCALEEYCSTNDVSPILDCIAMALRLALDTTEEKSREDNR